MAPVETERMTMATVTQTQRMSMTPEQAREAQRRVIVVKARESAFSRIRSRLEIAKIITPNTLAVRHELRILSDSDFGHLMEAMQAEAKARAGVLQRASLV